MKEVKNIFISLMIVTALVGYDIAHTPQKGSSVPLVKASDVVATASATPKQINYSPVEEYIRLIFGVYADRAMQLLTDPRCHENQHLDPLAVNDNRTWGGKGRDRGIFQISDYFHPNMTDDMAFDYKQNIDYAWKMFVNDNFTFRRWTCGKYLGI